jgi:hypothetical protein
MWSVGYKVLVGNEHMVEREAEHSASGVRSQKPDAEPWFQVDALIRVSRARTPHRLAVRRAASAACFEITVDFIMGQLSSPPLYHSPLPFLGHKAVCWSA